MKIDCEDGITREFIESGTLNYLGIFICTHCEEMVNIITAVNHRCPIDQKKVAFEIMLSDRFGKIYAEECTIDRIEEEIDALEETMRYKYPWTSFVIDGDKIIINKGEEQVKIRLATREAPHH